MTLGSADELHQRFVPQRTSTITDLGFDVCGGYFAPMMLFAAIRVKDRLAAPAGGATATRCGMTLIALQGSTLSGGYSA